MSYEKFQERMKTYIKDNKQYRHNFMQQLYSKRKTVNTEIRQKKTKNSNNRNLVEQSFKLVNFGDSVAKLIVRHQIIRQNKHEATNFSQREAKVKENCRQVERFKINNKESKAENIMMHVGTNRIQRESPRDSSKEI